MAITGRRGNQNTTEPSQGSPRALQVTFPFFCFKTKNKKQKTKKKSRRDQLLDVFPKQEKEKKNGSQSY